MIKNKDKSLFNAEEYTLKDFNEKNTKENQNNNNAKEEEKISEIEVRNGRLILITDEKLLFTIKKMKENFGLINVNKLDVKVEEEKLTMKNLLEKLFTNLLKERDNDKLKPEIMNITNEEIKTIGKFIRKAS